MVTLLFDLFFSDLFLVPLEFNGIHLLERIRRRIVCLINDGVVLLVTFNDTLGRRTVHNCRTARCVDVVLENVRIQVTIVLIYTGSNKLLFYFVILLIKFKKKTFKNKFSLI